MTVLQGFTELFYAVSQSTLQHVIAEVCKLLVQTTRG